MNLVLVKIWEKNPNSDNMRIPTYILAYLLTLIVKELKISAEKGRAITTFDIIKH